MSPVFGILLAAVLFAVFGALQRRGGEVPSCGTDLRSCDKAEAAGGCSACHPTYESVSPESSHARL